MAIKNIELICIPCAKCDNLEKVIRDAIASIEIKYRIKIPYGFKHTKTLQNLSDYSVNASQTPAVLINGRVEFAGAVNVTALRTKLESIHKGD